MKKILYVVLVNIILMGIVFFISLIVVKNRFITSYIKNTEGKNVYLELGPDMGHYTSYKAISKAIQGKLGFKENATIAHKLVYKKATIYNVNYNIDSLGNRSTVNPPNTDSDLYIFGCSDVFGIGLSEEDTLASQLSKKLIHVNVHNQGIPASGTNVFYYLLTEQKQVDLKKNDRVIYVAAEGHIGRTAGRVTPYMGHFPEYKMVNSNLTYKGLFNESSIADFVRKTVFESWLVEIVPFNSPYFLSDSDVSLTCGLLDNSQKFISSKNADFYVLLHPNLGSFEREVFLKCMSRNPSIKYLNLEWGPEHDGEFFIPVDGHPSAKGNQDLAEELFKHMIERR